MTDIVALGAGRMGRGIAQVFAYAGHDVTILDFKERTAEDSDKLLAEGKVEIAENLKFLYSLGIGKEENFPVILGRIKGGSIDDADTVLGNAKFIFEGVPELLDLKKDALGRASDLAGADTIIASTTSTMLSTELAGFTSRPENFLNAHFLNPAYLIPLVEVSPSEHTDPDQLDKFTNLLKSIGKVPVRCSASPGFIVPRLQSAAMNEAVRMVEEGVATPEEIDRAVMTGFGIRYATMGLIEFVDWGGVEILHYADAYLSENLGERFKAPAVIGELIEKGHLGMNHGKGFYDFENIDVGSFKKQKMATFIALLEHLKMLPKAADS